MEPHAVGEFAESQVSANVHLAATDYACSAELRRSSPAVSLFPDTLHVVWRPSTGSEDLGHHLCKPGVVFLLLVHGSPSHSLLAARPAGIARVFGAISLPAQHGQGAALRDHLPNHRHSFLVSKEILAAAAVEFCIYSDLRHVCVADSRRFDLDGSNWLD